METWIKSISMKEMVKRYGVNTAGDYWRPTPDLLNIRVIGLNNSDYEFLIAIHEMIEEYICTKRGIKETDIQKFDQQCEDDEPGDNPSAPYHKEHVFAECLERLLALELGVNWEEYGNAIDKAVEV